MVFSPTGGEGCGPRWTAEEFDIKMRELYEQYKRKHELFHTLWTKAVGKEDYDKKEWMEFEGLIKNPNDRIIYGEKERKGNTLEESGKGVLKG